MIEETNWKKFLTEKILRECWHGVDESGDIYCCKKCGKARPSILLGKGRSTDNRTFDNQDDTVELYNKIKCDKKWKGFEDFLFGCWHDLFLFHEDEKRGYVRWLLCLNSDECKERCEIIARFYGYDK
jgi:hypothetical protein